MNTISQAQKDKIRKYYDFLQEQFSILSIQTQDLDKRIMKIVDRQSSLKRDLGQFPDSSSWAIRNFEDNCLITEKEGLQKIYKILIEQQHDIYTACQKAKVEFRQSHGYEEMAQADKEILEDQQKLDAKYHSDSEVYPWNDLPEVAN